MLIRIAKNSDTYFGSQFLEEYSTGIFTIVKHILNSKVNIFRSTKSLKNSN